MKTVKKSPESASTRMGAVGLGARQPRLPLFIKQRCAVQGHSKPKGKATCHKPSPCISIILSFLYCAIPTHLEAAIFEAEGEITYSAFLANGANLIETQKEFTVFVTNCQWRIRLQRVKEDDDPVLSEDVGFDGDDIYHVQHGDPAKAPADVKNPIMSRGKVYTSNAPITDGSQVAQVWLAFASSCYYRSATNGLVSSMLPQDQHLVLDGDDTATRATWIFDDSSPKLLKEARYYSNGKMWSAESGDGLKRVERPKPFNTGFLEALYVVHQLTNYAGHSIPLSFSLTVFAPKKDGHTTNDTYVVMKWAGITKSAKITPVNTSIFPEPAAGPIAATDYRFRQGKEGEPLSQPVTYLVRNKWPPKSDRKLGQLAAISRQSRHETDRSRYYIPTMIFALLTIGFLLSYRRFRGRQP